MGEARCPSDMDIKKWLFAVAPTPAGPGNSHVNTALANRHMAMLRAMYEEAPEV